MFALHKTDGKRRRTIPYEWTEMNRDLSVSLGLLWMRVHLFVCHTERRDATEPSRLPVQTADGIRILSPKYVSFFSSIPRPLPRYSSIRKCVHFGISFTRCLSPAAGWRWLLKRGGNSEGFFSLSRQRSRQSPYRSRLIAAAASACWGWLGRDIYVILIEIEIQWHIFGLVPMLPSESNAVYIFLQRDELLWMSCLVMFD